VIVPTGGFVNDSESIKKALTEELAACMAATTAQAGNPDSGPHAAHPKHRTVRPTAVAGSFYPANPELLATTVDQMLADVPECGVQGDPIVLIAPHAGYIYSGPVAAHTYALLRGKRYKRVVVLAPSHREGFAFTSIYSGAAYATPLGEIPVDRNFSVQLAALAPSIA
jgi:predicted class III extradiol MEMO1 family dioxygenase